MARKTTKTMTLDELATALSGVYGDELRAVVLYGSAARSEGMTQRSDHNVLVIVRSLTPAALRASAATVHAWSEAGNPPPLVLTEAEWASSRDIFAIEYADILEQHRVLTGALPDGPAGVDPAHLRHQLEFEAMGKLIRFRQALLACEGDQAGDRTAGWPPRARCWCCSARCSGCTASARRRRVGGGGARGGAGRPRCRPVPGCGSARRRRAAIPHARADAVVEAYHAGLKRFVAHVDALVHPG
jgi:hypothetical protein